LLGRAGMNSSGEPLLPPHCLRVAGLIMVALGMACSRRMALSGVRVAPACLGQGNGNGDCRPHPWHGISGLGISRGRRTVPVAWHGHGMAGVAREHDPAPASPLPPYVMVLTWLVGSPPVPHDHDQLVAALCGMSRGSTRLRLRRACGTLPCYILALRRLRPNG
jgi:hypothetical protein